jgi:hypothetical protein
MLADRDIFDLPGLSAEACARLVAAVADDPANQSQVTALKDEFQREGISWKADDFERALLRRAAAVNEPRVAALPVHESVKRRLIDEFHFYSQPPAKEVLFTGTHLFTTGCKMISLRRFPAGPMDWEISGVPRSWLPKFRKRDLPRVLLFLATRLHGFRPLFFMHVARRPKNRSLLVEREVLRSYYRMARSLELQPGIKGIMASAWFHDPAAVANEPHLSCLNRPYQENGGLIVTMGPAAADAGFLERNVQRKEQLEAGALSYQLGLALWPRAAALAWARRHPELED